jgi:hypothetical protein
MFQKCPICEGTGEDSINVPFNAIPPICSVCKGEKIISTLTGLPPNRIQQFPSAINPSVIGPHTSPNNFDAKSYIESFKQSQNKDWGLPDNTFAPVSTPYIRNPDDNKKIFPEQPTFD